MIAATGSSPATAADPWIEHAKRIIFDTYGVRVSLEAKNKDLLKFGRSDVVGTSKVTLMTQKTGTINETYLATNAITHLSSSDNSDTESIRVEGHTIDGEGNLTFVVQFKALTGQTKVALDTPLARCTHLEDNDSVETAGAVYAFEDDTLTAGVPNTGAKIHCIIPSGENNSLKAATSISQDDYWAITSFYADCLEKTSAFAEVHLEIRKQGKTFIDKIEISCSSTGARGEHSFTPFLIVPANSDVRLTAIANSSNTSISGGIQGVLLKA